MHYKVLTSKVQKLSSSKLNKVQKTCYMNSGEMVIYAFLKRFKSDNQRHVTLRSRQSDQNHKHVQKLRCS